MGDTGTKPKRTFLVGPGPPPPTSQTRTNNKNTIVSAPLNPTVSSSAAAPIETASSATETTTEVKNECVELFDPCTKQPIANLEALEKRVREIKKQKMKDFIEVSQWPSDSTNDKRIHLLQYILNMEQFIDDTFFKYTINGQLYEALWDIVLALGYAVNEKGEPIFEKTSEFRISLEKLDGVKDLDEDQLTNDGIKYLEKRKIDMGASGSSDITFLYKGGSEEKLDRDPCSYVAEELPQKNKIYFCSSKLFKDDSTKSAIKDLDIPKIFISAKNIDTSYIKHIIILVKDRDIISDKLRRAIHKEISEEASYVLGMKELFASLRKIYDIYMFKLKRDKKDIITIEDIKYNFQLKDAAGNIINPTGKSLQLRLHQMMAVDKIVGSIKEFNRNVELNKTRVDKLPLNNKFLIGILPRGGKTYIAGGIVRDTQFNTVVVILGAKSETLEQFKNDLFDSKDKGMIDFKNYDVIDVKDEQKDFTFDSTKKYILIMSAELFKMPDEYVTLTDFINKKSDATRLQLIEYIQSTYNFKQKTGEGPIYATKIVDGWIAKGRPAMKRRFLRELQGKVPGGRRADLFICDEAHLKQVTYRAATVMAGATEQPIEAVVEDDIDETTDETTDEIKVAKINNDINKVSTDIPIVYMTGTYFKPLKAFKPPPSQVVLWTYEDIENGKALKDNEQYFKDKFGIFYTNALDKCISYNQSYESIQLIYERFPRLNLITTSFTKEAKDAFEDQKKEGRGFSTIPQLFRLNDPKWIPSALETRANLWYDAFNNTAGIMRLINYLSPENTHINSIETNHTGVLTDAIIPINSALQSVDIIAQRSNDRLRLFTSEFKIHTQLWFLPKVTGSGSVYQRMCALAGCIFQNRWFRKNFIVLGVTSSVTWNIAGSKDNRVYIKPNKGAINEEDVGEFTWACPNTSMPLKKCILTEEKRARKANKGLIILAQDMLHLGISLECVDIVVLLDDTSNIDERIQKMYRALTESYSDETIFKRAGYIIDMNFFRTVNALVDYQIIATKNRADSTFTSEDMKDAVKKIIDLYAVDNDGKVLQSHIEEEIIEVLKKNYKSSYLSVINAGQKLNDDINDFLELRYKTPFDKLLEAVEKEKGTKVSTVRENESGVEQAEETGESGSASKGTASKGNYFTSTAENTDTILAEKKEAFKNSIRTTLKLGIFGSDMNDTTELLALIKGKGSESEEFRDILYDTLIKRGNISQVYTPTAKELFEDSKYSEGKTYKQMINTLYKRICKDIKDKTILNMAQYISKNIFNIFDGSLLLIQENVLGLQEAYNKLSVEEREILNETSETEDNELEDESEKDELEEDESEGEFIIASNKLKGDMLDILWNKLSEETKARFNKQEIDMREKEIVRRNQIFDSIIIPELEEISKSNSRELYIGMKRGYKEHSQPNQKFAEVLEYIVEHLAPKDKERHMYGEVFTPLELVDEMLSTLPKNVWKNKDFKWLDPANGIGNFPIKAILGQTDGTYERDGPYKGKKHFTYPGLLDGLKSQFANEQKCLEHIIDNMLFMVDINPKNNLIAKNLLKKLCPSSTPNVSQIDKKNGFLKDTSVLDFGHGKKVKEFDVIMGNPPYNKGAVRVAMVTSKTKKERKNLGISNDDTESGYWVKFVEKALVKGFLKVNGYLLFIHPITWFKPDNAGAHDLMLSKQLLNIRIFTDSISKKLFGGKGEITVAYYLLENKIPSTKTKIVNMNDGIEEVKLNKTSIIIKQGNTIFQKIQNKATLFGNNNVKHNTIKECNDTGQYKLITILEDSGVIKYVKSSVSHPDQTTPKVIIGGIPKPIVLFDKDGEYGLYKQGQRHYFIGKDLGKINDYFKTKLSTYILKYVKFEQKFIKPSYYPDVRTIDISIINDDTLADYFEFTPEERAEIAEMPLPIHPTSANIKHITCAQLAGEECPEDKPVRNPKTKKCVKECKEDEERDPESFKCKKIKSKAKSKKAKGGSRKSNKQSIRKTRKLKRN